jgi:hypothetical protein
MSPATSPRPHAGHPGIAAIAHRRAGPAAAAPLPRRPGPSHAEDGHLSKVLKLLTACSLPLAAIPETAHAAAATFVAACTQPLDFGSMVVMGSGSRTVALSGATTDSGVMGVSGDTPTAATFTVTYSRATGDLNIYVLTFQVTMPTVAAVTVNGVQGNLTNFTTDIPGISNLIPGQTATVIVAACIAASCGFTFHIGATLNVTAGSTGAVLPFSMPIVATVTPVIG